MEAVLERSQPEEDVMAEEEYETVSSCGPGPKHFTDVEELWDALEEYHKYHDGTVMRGMDGSLRGGGQSGIAYTDEWQRIVRQNKAIDRAMVRLAVVNPQLQLLLHHYYRRGLWEDSRGWLEAAAKVGLVRLGQERLSRRAFDWILEQAVWVLFALHRAPRRGW